jgi:hypothetical protein
MRGLEYLDENDVVRIERKKVVAKPKPKKADHKHEYVDNSCTKCDKIK